MAVVVVRERSAKDSELRAAVGVSQGARARGCHAPLPPRPPLPLPSRSRRSSLPFLSERSSFLAPTGSSSPCDAAQAAHMALSVISWGHCTCGYQATRRPERDQAAQTHAAASASSGAGQPHRPASPARSLRRGQRWRGHKGSRAHLLGTPRLATLCPAIGHLGAIFQGTALGVEVLIHCRRNLLRVVAEAAHHLQNMLLRKLRHRRY